MNVFVVSGLVILFKNDFFFIYDMFMNVLFLMF